MNEFLKRATYARNNKRILQRVTSDFLQQATSETSNEWILEPVTSEILQRATSAGSNGQKICNEQRVNFNE